MDVVIFSPELDHQNRTSSYNKTDFVLFDNEVRILIFNFFVIDVLELLTHNFRSSLFAKHTSIQYSSGSLVERVHALSLIMLSM